MNRLLLFLAIALSAQTPAAFEVASITPNKTGGGGSSIRAAKGRITMENVSLKKVTLWAYDIPDDREYALVGPPWLTEEHYDFQATFPADTTPQQVRQLTQALLAERFKLNLHRESRRLPIYTLVVAKNGPKIHAAEEGPSGTSGGLGRLEATRITMQKLADLLASLTGKQVVDHSGLKGQFSFTLEWSPDETQKNGPPAADLASGISGPSIFSALQEQLGLKLEAGKGPVEILVVDHIEKAPTQN